MSLSVERHSSSERLQRCMVSSVPQTISNPWVQIISFRLEVGVTEGDIETDGVQEMEAVAEAEGSLLGSGVRLGEGVMGLTEGVIEGDGQFDGLLEGEVRDGLMVTVELGNRKSQSIEYVRNKPWPTVRMPLNDLTCLYVGAP